MGPQQAGGWLLIGEPVQFASNGGHAEGYLAVPESGSAPGVVVIQEWWGLDDQIKEVVDRFASEGFVAFAPDIFRGAEASVKEPDEAGKLMMALNIEQAAKDMAGAIDFLKRHPAVTGSGVGVIGFGMGGGLALWLATLRPDDVKAVAPYYGVIPWPAAQPDYSKLQAPVQGHYAENDDFAGPPAVQKLEAELTGLGRSFEFFIYPGTVHAFTNHQRPEVHHPEHAESAWNRTIQFFREHVT